MALCAYLNGTSACCLSLLVHAHVVCLQGETAHTSTVHACGVGAWGVPAWDSPLDAQHGPCWMFDDHFC